MLKKEYENNDKIKSIEKSDNVKLIVFSDNIERIKFEREMRKGKIKFLESCVFNTSWAKDNENKPDASNLLCAFRFRDMNGKIFTQMPSRVDMANMINAFNEIKRYNTKHDNQGRRFTNSKKLMAMF